MALLSKSRSGVEEVSPLTLKLLKGWKHIWTSENRWGIGVREIFAALGPGFLVSVGYMDPGNWGTNLAAGAGYGYTLLWVILASNLIAIFLQISAAKLGIATGKDLAQLIREHFPRPFANAFGATAIIAIMATDLAEILGGALGFNILFGIPLFPAAILTGMIVMGLLALSRWGFRKLEYVIIGFVSIIGLAYVYETTLIRPDWGQIALHTVVPQFSAGSILVAVGILGATVMPHNVFLHSFLAPLRLSSPEATLLERKKVFRLAKIDTIAALNVAFFVNAAMLVVAGAIFYKHVDPATLDLQTASATLTPILGGLASLAFGIGLLASGLSSSTTGTIAGQIVLRGFLNMKVKMWIWRIITLLPALLVTSPLFHISSVEILVISQVILSLQLPFTMGALVILTSRKKIMGAFVNSRLTQAFNILLVVLVTALNVWLLYSYLPIA
ncbi:Nramp family divalent metal transporter [Tengunoibacter tsumagoiensis]|uniref:Divalent metal cation transporter MntH n=1 Tax=Tengunoibacter tsumagoiensis TaxID=2014871 RepID=A0A401ZZR6_9CHLR|nr:Nramp family divalent metal transporter [Tengunoibacter tsumagoiensis]GCE12291.1 divalent metal cation transporter MntH [Tengunoibacter tsumagoiensis]